MMDRQLTVEFPVFNRNLSGGAYSTNIPTGYEQIDSNLFKYESTIDLGGYTRQDDLTVFFRRSFEQLGGADSIFWNAYDPASDSIVINTIISSVPMTNEQLILSLMVQPGFTPFSSVTDDFGNFNRTHIIHGRLEIAYANSIVGSSAFGALGNATLMNVVDNYYSSLEATAADTLYCYRVIGLPRTNSNIQAVNLPAKRVILDAYVDAEPNNEYLMRLKRSYELANQV